LGAKHDLLTEFKAIHLNHWHSLRRRLRHVQKEKLALRNEIIRLKGEREQVALRMDAIRIKHEADSKESTVSRSTPVDYSCHVLT
jgi:hypothetical protein